MRVNLLFGFFASALLVASPAQSAVKRADFEKLRTYRLEAADSSRSWVASKPKIVLLGGYLEDSNQKLLEKWAAKELSALTAESPNSVLRSAEWIVVKNARAQDLMQALRDPNTIGVIFASHTYTHRKVTFPLTADFHPVPAELLSAALPSLRFISFLGCSGGNIGSMFSVSTQLLSLNWDLTVMHSLDSSLSMVPSIPGLPFRIGLPYALNRIKSTIKLAGNIDWSKSREPAPPSHRLSLDIKDVKAGYEPRYIYVGKSLVGSLGSTAQDSNEKSEWKPMAFDLYAHEHASLSSRSRIEIRGTLMDAPIVDNYLVRSLILTDLAVEPTPFTEDPIWTSYYSWSVSTREPALPGDLLLGAPRHLGHPELNCAGPPQHRPLIPSFMRPGNEDQVPRVASELPEQFRREFVRNVQWETGDEKAKAWAKMRPGVFYHYMNEMAQGIRFETCMNLRSSQWTPYHSRFLSLKLEGLSQGQNQESRD